MLSLESWEEKTQLSDVQKQTVHDLQEACIDLPLPSSWYVNKWTHSPIHTPPLKRNLSTADLLSTPQPTKGTIETLQSFHDWFAVLEQEMDQGDVYRDHLQKVVRYRDACDHFLDCLDETKEVLKKVEEDYGWVLEKTRMVQAEPILKRQLQLTRLADGLADRLSYFNPLENVARLLNSSKENVCLDPEFIPVLNQLDQCIAYMNEHAHYRDAELYLIRFRQYMTRGMTLIKMYSVSTLKNLGQDIYKQLKDPSVSIGKQTTLCFVKFKSMAPTMKSLIHQIEKRCKEHEEYQSLYDDILYTYFQTRHYLLVLIITRKLQSDTTALVSMAKSECAYMMNMCTDEFNLYHHFFQSSEEDRLYQYLELLTQQFYNHLWSKINREQDKKILSELCSLFSMYVTQDEQCNHLFAIVEEESKQVQVGSAEFWSQIVAIICLVILSGIIAGLTLGLMSLDVTNLKILQLAGTRKQQYYATRILPIRQNGHILLTTLLLTNTVLNETLPILFDGIFCKGFISVIVSTVLLVLFSEIIPQAVFSKHGLAIGSLFAFPVRLLIGLWFIVAWPISKLLDWMLGAHEGFSYTESELGALIQLHDMTKNKQGCLNHQVSLMAQNVLQMQERKVSELLSSMSHLLFIPSDTLLNPTLISSYISHKYTHILVYESKGSLIDEDSVIGVLTLSNLSKEENFSKPAGELELEPCLKVHSSIYISQLMTLLSERKQEEQVILVYRTEQEMEQSKEVKPILVTHQRSLSCRLKKFFGYLCHQCSHQEDEEEVDKSTLTIDVGLVGMLTTRDILHYVLCSK
ncbi:hypothetical protein G6F57_009357 [Rhizopus arrhizus]|uniref:Conserved oligomeric Golgi complex subunit 3 n=1 Tax=Rhizopus oryzae TaxID=64495 RepID=A0A9P6X3E6_RHIOR|nr:hypothetical protein G6F30_009948 [Rhizopus arrhizus]KAG1416203.1 hypothetical protein G6F58_006091 [Rhizopus delemar]KAG0985305.1 hypothetical protein G6F29_004121 [Rhizopus arrhizus]KAG0988876.1 hypothetical protein G6F28_009689 [Rhizopus arrhizus]KAG1013423.1 hypothetical protein G6F27_001902 [Rhizopus arrhizus]